MISSFNAGFKLKEKLDPNVLHAMTATMLSGEDITWQDMVGHFNGTFPGYIALLIFDQSPSSKTFQKIVSQQYMDLDRITGDDLLVLSTVPPPKKWFFLKSSILARLPETARNFHEKEITLLGTEEGKSVAEYNTQKVIGEFFEMNWKFPCISFLYEVPSVDEPGTDTIEGFSFEVSGFQSPAMVKKLFEDLKKAAKKSVDHDGDVRKFAEEAFSVWNPTSLRFKNAGLKTLALSKLMEKLVGKITGLSK